MNHLASETLNDLILINNDRIKGYEKIVQNTEDKDEDLKVIFQEMIEETRRFNMQLIEEVEHIGATPETESSLSGKLHRAWIGIRSTFHANHRKTLLMESEKGEDATQEAYNEALHENNGLSERQLDIVAEQARLLMISHGRIKMLRDEALHPKD